MKFDELQVIWNAQQDQPLFTINHDALYRLVQQKTSRIEVYIKCFEWTMISVPLLMAVILPIDAWREGGGWDQYVVAVICLCVGISTLVNRFNRLKTPISFAQSIRGIIEHSLVRIDEHVRRLTLIFWCFHFPIAVSAAIGLTFYSNLRIPLIWGGVLLVTAFSYWGTRRDAQKMLQEKQELEQLSAKLTEAEPSDAASGY